MDDIMKVAAVITIFIMMALMLIVLIWAGIEFVKMKEKLPAGVFFAMAGIWATLFGFLVAIAVERGL